MWCCRAGAPNPQGPVTLGSGELLQNCSLCQHPFLCAHSRHPVTQACYLPGPCWLWDLLGKVKWTHTGLLVHVGLDLSIYPGVDWTWAFTGVFRITSNVRPDLSDSQCLWPDCMYSGRSTGWRDKRQVPNPVFAIHWLEARFYVTLAKPLNSLGPSVLHWGEKFSWRLVCSRSACFSSRQCPEGYGGALLKIRFTNEGRFVKTSALTKGCDYWKRGKNPEDWHFISSVAQDEDQRHEAKWVCLSPWTV